MQGISLFHFSLLIFNALVGILLPVIHRKSKYFYLFILLVTVDLLTLVFRQYLPYTNFFYVVSAILKIPSLYRTLWGKPGFYIPVLVAGAGIVLLPILNPIISLYIMFLGIIALSLFVLLDLIQNAVSMQRFNFFAFALFMYVFSPSLRMYFIVSGTKISEYYFFIIYTLEIVAAFALLFLREDKPGHYYRYKVAQVKIDEQQ